MRQYEAVIKVMEENGGYATLGHLYQNVLLVKGPKWRTKTPYATIRRIVQDERFFFRIRPGLWALRTYEGEVRRRFKITPRDKQSIETFSHYYYQGLLVEIGNITKYGTYVPAQDKNRRFLETPLKDLTSIAKIHPFSYDKLIRRASTVDVIWFNSRHMPAWMFEVEHSTKFSDSLLKFVELQDFFVRFRIVADGSNERQYRDRISLSAFDGIRDRVEFLDYERVSEWHASLHKIAGIYTGRLL